MRWKRPRWIAGAGALAATLWVGTPTVLRRLAFFRVRQVELVGVQHLAPEGELKLDWEDEITAGACVTREKAPA